MSELKVNKISPATGTDFTLGDSGDVFTVPSGATFTNSGTATGFGGGKVLQCVQNHVIAQSTQTLPATSGAGAAGYSNITNLNKAITPTESNSNILIQIRYCGEMGHTSPLDLIFGINRDSTAIGNPAASGTHPIGITSWVDHDAPASTQSSTSYSYMDTTRSAGTSAITYHATVRFNHGGTLYNNRTATNTDDLWHEYLTSTIILWELSA